MFLLTYVDINYTSAIVDNIVELIDIRINSFNEIYTKC